jgi:preprotein translocase subunit SecY
MQGFSLFVLFAAAAVVVVAAIVFIERAQRRLLIQYPKRQGQQGLVGGNPRSCR